MNLTLPSLTHHELRELTTPEILRRSIEEKITELRASVRGREGAIGADLARIDRERLEVSRERAVIAGWEGLLARLDAPAEILGEAPAPATGHLVVCSLCVRGDGCDSCQSLRA